jgi:hypothetical protein
MIKKTIEFLDLDGNKVRRDFWFNLNKSDLAKMELVHGGGYEQFVKKIIEAKDTKRVVDLFDELLELAYGIRDEDGISFRKIAPDGHKYWDDFKATDAYSELFYDLISNAAGSAEFVAGMLPKELAATAKTTIQAEINRLSVPDDEKPDEVIEGQVVPDLADTILAGMSDEEKAALRDRLL